MAAKFIFILIFLLAIFLRFYRLPDMASFDFDQEYAANFAYSVLKIFPIQLIGQGLSVEGLFLGPIYFYFLVPFFALSNLHPIGGFVASSLVGLVIVAAYFWVGKELFGAKAGLIAAFLRAILFNELIHDFSMAPAYASELLVLITWYIFYNYSRGETKLFPILGLSFGLFTSIHPILFPFYLVFLILLLIKRKLPNFKTALTSIVAIIIPLTPLIYFEFIHNFLEVKRLVEVFGKSGEAKDPGKFLNYLQFNFSEIQRILSFNFISKESFSIIVLIIIIIFITKKPSFWKEAFHKYVLFITYLVFLIYYTLFPTHVPEYYFLALTSLAILYIGASLSLLKGKYGVIILILIIANISFINIRPVWDRWNNSSLITLSHKDAIVREIIKKQPKGKEFFVSYISLPGWVNGFNYLFKLYGQVPQTIEARPPIYSIIIPKFLVSEKDMNFTSGNIGLILPK